MKSLLVLALASCLVPLSAQAQEAQRPHWHVVAYGSEMMVTMDIHGATREGTTVTAEVGTYMPQTVSPIGEAQVDFISSLWQFDCSKPNTVRTLKVKGFLAYVGPATLEDDVPDAQWRTVAAETGSGQSWQAACKGVPEGTALYGVTSHEEVLAKYRAAIE